MSQRSVSHDLLLLVQLLQTGLMGSCPQLSLEQVQLFTSRVVTMLPVYNMIIIYTCRVAALSTLILLHYNAVIYNAVII